VDWPRMRKRWPSNPICRGLRAYEQAKEACAKAPAADIGRSEAANGDHDVYKHPARPGRIILPRHRMLSPGVARVIAKQAGWFD
jgi:hypothetical protein